MPRAKFRMSSLKSHQWPMPPYHSFELKPHFFCLLESQTSREHFSRSTRALRPIFAAKPLASCCSVGMVDRLHAAFATACRYKFSGAHATYSEDMRMISIFGKYKWPRKDEHPIDDAAERRRLDQRVVFDADRWRKHRSASRFLRAFPTIPMSSVMLQTLKPVLTCTMFTIFICMIQVVSDSFFFHLPTSLFALSGPTLGLLLVFRTNSSYERWDGARKMIGMVKNRSEDLVRQTCVHFPADRPDLKEQMLRYTQAFFFALKVHLRSGPGGLEDDGQLTKDLTPILKPRELYLLQQAQNRPAHILQCMTRVMHAARLDSGVLICMDQNLTMMADVLGGCERILRTPIPLSYTRMTTRFLLIWLFLLPLALSWEIVKLDCSIWLAPPCIAFLAFLLLGVDEVAVQIEEPFSILPLEAYAEGSRKNTEALFRKMQAVEWVVQNPEAPQKPPQELTGAALPPKAGPPSPDCPTPPRIKIEPPALKQPCV
eukprot:EG_transcript_7621